MQAAGQMLTQVTEEPWAAVCADFVGPLPRSKHGNQMLLVMIDRFSKWKQLEHLRRATAESLKKAFRERIITRYAVPKVVITDNGVQFASRIFKRFLAEMGIRQQFTAPQDNNQDYVCAVRRTGPEKLGREVAGDYASSQHEQIGIHRPYTGVSHPGQETASTQQSM